MKLSCFITVKVLCHFIACIMCPKNLHYLTFNLLDSVLTHKSYQDKLSLLRIITEKALKEWSGKHSRAKTSLIFWVSIVKFARWNSMVDLLKTFPSADHVTTGSGRKVIIFNIAGNQFRLICAVHFKTKLVFALRFMTHAEYDRFPWKDSL